MRKKATKSFVLIISMIMLSGTLAACSGGDNNTTEKSNGGSNSEENKSSNVSSIPEETTLNIMLWGDKPKQFDDVVAEFERQTKDTLNLKLNFTFTPQADYVNKLKLKLAAGEQVDIAFDAPWMNMNTFIAQNNYTNLDSYFNNDKYPGLKKAFGEGYLNNNKFTGADGQPHTYGVPLGQYLGDLSAIYYRKDLAAKYGMSDITTYDQLLAFYDNVMKNDKNMIPLVIKNDGQYGTVTVIEGNKEMPNKSAAGLWDITLGPNVTATAHIQDNKVSAVSLTGDKAENIAAFPEPFNKKDYTTYQQIREWHDKGYIEKEPIVRKDAKGTFTAGKAASMVEGLSNIDAINAQLKAGVPSAELGVFVTQETARNKVQPNPNYVSDFRIWNFLCIPETSENADRAMAFVNWLFESQDNHDLFELGIKGKNWETVGDDKFKYPDGIDLTQNYSFPGYMLTWNPNYIRLSSTVPDHLVEYYRYIADEKTYIKSAVAGFAFNQDPVKNELANPDFVKVSNDELAYKLGMVGDPAKGMAKLQQKWESNSRLQQDIETIKAELRKQLEAYLDQQSAG
ncbi:extracellular solute-binding protein [Paenibacillus glycanilyticus]|uniref:ABC transporter substrate-binding protein n=1 Tax=Paenibacillus glycanilyticus TaxID=126569 RepID=A0ABQ6GEC1_9BACL|nr:extracellular solute-binding protein [Paenibacillus glycanilyticus]GLX68588.1 ABC transporter substrate-binding protein [Paenibacillus glycanilyticus]